MILLVGAGGMLGSEVARLLPGAVTVGRETLDLATDFTLPPGGWDWIVNCAAYTAVDRAEGEPELARRVNADGVARLARLAQERGARLLHVSTDFVFDGCADRPYREEDPTVPLGVYGGTKRDGEAAVLAQSDDHLVVRTAWLFGAGPCFPRTMARAWEAGKTLRVVDDQRGSPSYAPDVAAAIALLIEREAPGGIYHAAGVKAVTWHDLAVRSLRAWRLPDDPRPIEIAPVATAEYPTPAPRPAYSVLDVSRMLGLGWRPRHLDDALADWATRLRASSGPL